MSEKLDLEWWHSLTGKEQGKYLKSHPGSKYASHVHLSDKAEPPFDWKNYNGRLKDLRLVSFPISKYADDDLDARWKYHQKAGHKAEYANVPVEKIVATQPAVDTRWTPDRVSKYGPPITGLMNKNGFVHLYDGHHRAEHAYNNGARKIRILVHHHTAQDENNVRKMER
jgi:hypothetical protein